MRLRAAGSVMGTAMLRKSLLFCRILLLWLCACSIPPAIDQTGMVTPRVEPPTIPTATPDCQPAAGVTLHSLYAAAWESDMPNVTDSRFVNPRLVGPTEFDDLEDLEVALVARKDLATLLDNGQVTHALVVSALETYLRRFPSSTSSPS